MASKDKAKKKEKETRAKAKILWDYPKNIWIMEHTMKKISKTDFETIVYYTTVHPFDPFDPL
jgi:hypothetical protein